MPVFLLRLFSKREKKDALSLNRAVEHYLFRIYKKFTTLGNHC